jgi:hypothetical protein
VLEGFAMKSEQVPIDDTLIASVLSKGIRLGIVTRETVIAWADHLIAQSQIPSGWMIDLSLSQNFHDLDVVAILDRIGDGADPAAMCRAMYGFLEVPADCTFEVAERFAKRLYDIACDCLDMDWSSSLLVEADQIDDTFLLMQDGTISMSEQEAVGEVRKFLEENREMRVKNFLAECARPQQPIK